MGKTFEDWKVKRKRKGLSTVIPIRKKCIHCKKRRVKYHHTLCKICWRRNNKNGIEN